MYFTLFKYSTVSLSSGLTELKTYSNNLYSVQITINGTSSNPTSNNYPYQALAKTTSTFKICNYNSGTDANTYYQWEAKGA